MLNKIKKRIESELSLYTSQLEKIHSLKTLSPVLFNYIKEFISRGGKRVRPTLFIIGYLGFSGGKAPPGLYRSALSIEMLHDFMLVHDDIIDKSDMRRGKPSMHKMFEGHLSKYRDIKFSGQDLSIVAGDVIYAMAIDAFLSIKEDYARKEAGLRRLIAAALYTGAGEFIELLAGAKNIETITKEEIYKIYDYKTAYYTFASPLTIGATLAGAVKTETEKLFKYGILLGRAFQINDDILGMFGSEEDTGKPVLTDLQEAKKTILIWYAWHNSNKENKTKIKTTLNKEKAALADLLTMRNIITTSGALDYARKEISRSAKEAKDIMNSSKIKPRYKDLLQSYSGKILNIF